MNDHKTHDAITIFFFLSNLFSLLALEEVQEEEDSDVEGGDPNKVSDDETFSHYDYLSDRDEEDSIVAVQQID
jgi:hypothetical protein